ncbi:MAG: IS1595 family transposase [Methylacidiphilales bacterium]|nr:IS1595 family transposase [Candidatus Methylacidiphilales bacterium]
MKTKTTKKKEKASITIRDFFRQFPSDNACLEHIFTIRFGQGHACPKCERKANWYKIQAERAYSCQWCGHHLHPTVGTPFEDSRTPLQLWFYAIYLFTTSRHGVPAKELERQLGVTYKCAWRMGHEIRKHITQVDGEFPLFGQVEIDETYVGGRRAGTRGRGADGKTIVFGMLERGGQVMTKIVPSVKAKDLQPIIEENVAKGSTVHTDELRSYKGLERVGYDHQTVDHGSGEYVKGNSHVNSLESFWARLKNSVKGTHVHVSKKHLGKYAKEFEFRFNSKSKPISMFPSLVSSFAPST